MRTDSRISGPLAAAISFGLCMGLCQSACSRHGGGDPLTGEPDDSAHQGGATYDFIYSIRGDTLMLRANYESRHCVGDSLATYPPLQNPLTYKFEVRGDDLSTVNFEDTLGSGAVVRWIGNFKRVGSASGLQGVWLRAPVTHQVVSGTPTPAEQMRLDSSDANSIVSQNYREVRITITDRIYSERIDLEFAAQFADYWNGEIGSRPIPDSMIYDIALRIVDKYTVELKGLKNLETVTYSFFANYDHVYSSSDPAHAPLHYQFNPTSCPNQSEPDWYKPFLNANLKATAPPRP